MRTLLCCNSDAISMTSGKVAVYMEVQQQQQQQRHQIITYKHVACAYIFVSTKSGRAW